MGCTKAVLEAKLNYRMTIHEAKMIRGNLLQESEIVYSKALGKAVAMKSSKSVTLHREHVRIMQELEEQAIREESKSHHDFLSAYQAILCHAPQPLKENLTTSYHVLLGWSPPSPPSAPPARAPLVGEQPSLAASPRPAPKQSSWLKWWHPLLEPQGNMSIDETSLKPCRRDHPTPRDERLLFGSPHSNPVMQRPSAETLTS